MKLVSSNDKIATPESDPAQKPASVKAAEDRYMQGDREPATSSVLISNSKYLNNPLYRDAFIQASLRRFGHDLPPTYHIPWMVRAIDEVTDRAEIQRLIDEEKARSPEFAAWLKERRLSRYVAAEMGHYADGTLGAAIRTFIQQPGFEIEFIHKDTVPATDLEYIVKRNSATHDIHHMVTGFGPNTAGEAALAFMNVAANSKFFSPALAQWSTAHNVFVSAAGYKRTALHYHGMMPTYLDAIQRGIAAGLGIKRPLLITQWEDYLDWQLDDIAADLGFARGPDETWHWTTEAGMG